MGTGAAPCSVCDVTDFGSVISRVSGESEAKVAKAIHSASNRRLSLIDYPRIMATGILQPHAERHALRIIVPAPLNLRILRKGIQTTVSVSPVVGSGVSRGAASSPGGERSERIAGSGCSLRGAAWLLERCRLLGGHRPGTGGRHGPKADVSRVHRFYGARRGSVRHLRGRTNLSSGASL